MFNILRSYTRENLLYPVLDQLSSSALVSYRRMFINRHMKCIHKSRHELMGWLNTNRVTVEVLLKAAADVEYGRLKAHREPMDPFFFVVLFLFLSSFACFYKNVSSTMVKTTKWDINVWQLWFLFCDIASASSFCKNVIAIDIGIFVTNAANVTNTKYNISHFYYISLINIVNS